MVRLIWKLTAGIGISAAIIYKMDQNITQQQSEMKHRLEEAKSTLEKAVVADERAQQEKTREYYRNTQKYMSDRLVPSVKNSWNTQISNAARSLVNVDIGSKIKYAWNEYVMKEINGRK